MLVRMHKVLLIQTNRNVMKSTSLLLSEKLISFWQVALL